MRRTRKNRGFITVFVTLIMVPVIVFTGTMVDLSRMKLYSSQAVMAADSYGEVVLSKYDNLLKELYGLFALTQDAKAQKAVEEMAAYAGYSFNPAGGDLDVEGFMPYKSAEVTTSYDKVEGATLANESVLMTQIGDFMKYRVILEVGEEAGILDIFSTVSSMKNDMKAIQERQEVAGNTDDIFEQMGDFYENLKELDAYPKLISQSETAYENYATALSDIYTGTLSDGEREVSYSEYVNYLENRSAIDAAKVAVEDAEKKAEERAEREAEYEAAVAEAQRAGTEPPAEPNLIDIPEVSEAQRTLAAQYVNQTGYQAAIDNKVLELKEALDVKADIAFGDVKGILSDMQTQQKYIENELKEIEAQVASLKAKLSGCSKELKESMTEELKELEKIADKAGAFKDTVNLLTTTYDSVIKDANNKTLWDDKTAVLKEVETNLRNGTQSDGEWDSKISFDWRAFRDDKADSLYQDLKELFEGTDGKAANKKAGDEKKDAAKAAGDTAIQEAELDKEEITAARDIPKVLISSDGITVNTGEVKSFSDFVVGDITFKDYGNTLIDKFLLSVYDFGMFSSRVTGIQPEDEEESREDRITESIENIQTLSEEITEEYYDESLTGIKMSRDVNYLYGAEIEYLLSGYDTSAKNLSQARNYICGIRMTMNYISTYTIKQINDVISQISTAAAEAVAATGVGAAAAPLIKFAVSGALRAAVAGIETAADWSALKERKEVLFYKSSLEDLTATDGVFGDLLDGLMEGKLTDIADKKPEGGIEFKLKYEDYMYILMYMFVDSSTLLERTSNLITLNVNQAEQKTEELTTLNFKMADTVTAIKSTCTVDLDFVIVPENFINMFIPNSNTTNIIQKLEDGKYGYSVIRSY